MKDTKKEQKTTTLQTILQIMKSQVKIENIFV